MADTVQIASIGFMDLPVDVKIYIFSNFLSADEIGKCSRVCSEWKMITNFLWRHMFERDKNSWKAFSSTSSKEAQQTGISSGARAFEEVKKVAWNMFEYLLGSSPAPSQSQPSQTSAPINDADAQNARWKQLYLQQHAVNKPSLSSSTSPNTNRKNVKDAPVHRIPMIGEGVDSKGTAKKLLYEVMWNPKSPIKMTGLHPGVEGVGSGVGFNVNDKHLNMIAMNKYTDRKLFEQARPMLTQFFKGCDGFVFVIDEQDDLQKAKAEIDTFITDKFIRPDTPLLILLVSLNQGSKETKEAAPSEDVKAEPSSPRVPVQMAEQLGLQERKEIQWLIRTLNVETMEGTLEGLAWLTSQLKN
mmetsp:Transcript_12016/g.16629  ORF Transcript_12016/g.16629 Transcript_12016/m.16629 type:complete len:357 (-) Transcript_12016:123-1193(-)